MLLDIAEELVGGVREVLEFREAAASQLSRQDDFSLVKRLEDGDAALCAGEWSPARTVCSEISQKYSLQRHMYFMDLLIYQ